MKFFDKLFGVGKELKSQIKVGDWVNSYSKGIYRVEKMFDLYYEENSPTLGQNKVGDKMRDRTIVTKRFLNSKYEKSISYESCSEYFIKHLDSVQTTELKKTIAEHPEYIGELNQYKIPDIITVYNYKLQISNDDDLSKVQGLVNFIKSGRTFQEIEIEMTRIDVLKFKAKNFGNYLLQFNNVNEEYLNKKRIWRDARLINS